MTQQTYLWCTEYKEKLAKWKETKKSVEWGVNLRRQRRGEAAMTY